MDPLHNSSFNCLKPAVFRKEIKMIRNACIIIAVIATIIISRLGASNNTEVPVAQNIEIDEDIDVQNSFDYPLI